MIQQFKMLQNLMWANRYFSNEIVLIFFEDLHFKNGSYEPIVANINTLRNRNQLLAE
jgi:hypothetical protein